MEICEVDADVSEFVEQPARLSFASGSRTYTPDFYLNRGGRPFFVEVKWESLAESPANELRWIEIAERLNRCGFGFEVVTERHIFKQPRSSNIQALLRSRLSCEPSENLRNQFAAHLRAGPTTLGAIREQLGLSDKEAMRLLLERECDIDLSRPLGPETIVRARPIR